MPRPAEDCRTDEAALAAARAFPFGFDPASITFIDKGFSPDRKFRVTGPDGDLLLRICDEEQAGHKREEFDRIESLYRLGLPVAEPLKLAPVPPFVGGLFRWIEGESGEELIAHWPKAAQCEAGLQAGRLLRRLHFSQPSDRSTINEAEIRGGKFHQAFADCAARGLTFEKKEQVSHWVDQNLWRIENRPVAFRHGDYHPANLIFRDQSLVGVIDFNRCDFGDPWDDFYKLAYFAAPRSALFASAMIQGYFEGGPPKEFWPIYNLYVAAVVPADLSWCARLFPSDLEASRTRVAHVLTSHDFFSGGPPSWWITV